VIGARVSHRERDARVALPLCGPPTTLLPDRWRQLRMSDSYACDDMRDDDVLHAHLFERDLGMLGEGHTVGVIGVRGPDRHIAERVVDVAATRHQTGVAQELFTDAGIEMDWARRPALT